MKLSRRKTILGMGLLAGGSGAAFSSAALTNTTTPGATMEVYAEANLKVQRGDDTAGTYDSPYTINGTSDLPAAYVDTNQNNNLTVETANLIEPSSHTFSYLLEVVNNGDTEESVGFGFDSFGSAVDTGDGVGDISQADVQAIYSFKTNASDSDFTPSDGTDISAGSADAKDNPSTTEAIPAGNTLAIDLTVDPSVNISALRSAVGAPSGNPFTGNPVAGSTLVSGIIVGL